MRINSVEFMELEETVLETIDGGKEWYEWVGDAGLVIGGVACLVPGVGLGYMAAYAAAAYLYEVNK